MPNTTVPAAGEAMPAAQQVNFIPVLRVQDILGEARLLVEGIEMACSDLPPDMAGPIAAIANIARRKLVKAVRRLENFRETNGAGPTV